MNNLLHLLNTSQIPQHITDRDDISVFDKVLADLFGGLHCTSPHGLSSSAAAIK